MHSVARQDARPVRRVRILRRGVVLVGLRNAASRALVATALGGCLEVSFFTDAEALVDRVTGDASALRERVTTVIVDPLNDDGRVCEDAIRRLRPLLLGATFLLTCDGRPPTIAALPPLIRAGIDDVLTASESGSDAGDLRQQILGRHDRRFIPMSERLVWNAVPTCVRPIVRAALDLADHSATPAELAVAVGLSPRQLRRRLASEAAPPPGALLSWCRLMLVAYRLRSPDRSVEQVALASGFDSGAAVHNMLRRYTSLRVSDLRSHGDLVLVAEHLRRAFLGLNCGSGGNRRPTQSE